MNDAFIEKACATNCAAIDHHHSADLDAARRMVQEHPDLASRDIFTAAVCGNVAAVQGFLQSDPDSANRPGGPRNWTPLLYLCFSRFMRDDDPARVAGLLETACVLLEAGADPNTFFMLGDERETALYAACGVCNNAGLAELLLQFGANVNDEDATYHVAEFPRHDCMGVLLDHGLDADRSATVLLRKLDFDDIEGVRYLLDRGVDVNHPGYWGKTPLHQAIMRGRDLATIKLLVERDADVNAQRKSDGATPYLLACLYGREDVADLLVASGASTELTPVESLLAAGGLGKRDEALEIIEAHPQLLESLSDEQRLVITLAGRQGNLRALETMLDLGFDIATRDTQGFTALHWAAWYGHLDCVRLLIERGAPLDVKNNYGGTVIDSTVWGYANSDGNDRHCQEILEALVAVGGDVNEISPLPSGHGESDQILRGLGRR